MRKIAHFHWHGGPLSWLRWVTLVSFQKHNPDWEIRLHRTHETVFGLNEKASMSDWTRYIALYESGGLAFDTDIVFVKPIPPEWLHHQHCITIKNGRPAHMAVMGAHRRRS